ncbi:hypothetical protein HZC21_00030 [Candidatus Peregrinibacteria bacterium]|nr:hypothetical protein [Candidatus Peregrinibacteria bacterium]
MPKSKLPYKEFKWTPALAYAIGLLATDGNLSKDGRHITMTSNVFRDFLRGHLDGDGYIQTYTDNYNIYRKKRYINTRIYTRFISASEIHIRWLYKMIKKCLSVKGALLFKKPLQKNHVPMWEIRFAKYDSLKLFKWFYYKQDLPALARKRKIAESLLKRVVNNKLIR